MAEVKETASRPQLSVSKKTTTEEDKNKSKGKKKKYSPNLKVIK